MSKVERNVTPKYDEIAFEVEQMMGKAMCAYANLTDIRKNRAELVFKYGIKEYETTLTALESELEATERCIAMLVTEHLPEIGMIVIERAKEEFDL